ncbi:hypothetical protein KC926_00880 [Candidatus Kaiserbacteria bacterium]|nr:hypothetical protein [Candidatus Kaiserbacteria bacterium]
MTAINARSTSEQQYTEPVVPLKELPSCPDAKSLFAKIIASQDFSPIVRGLLREKIAKDHAEADQLIKAFVQWYATGSVTVKKSYVMFVGEVDSVMHEMILNSKWYMSFCYNTTGVYTHHEPIDEMDMSDDMVMNAAFFTAHLLTQTWGNELHPKLQVHVDAVTAGSCKPSSVSCVGNSGPFDLVPIHT